MNWIFLLLKVWDTSQMYFQKLEKCFVHTHKALLVVLEKSLLYNTKNLSDNLKGSLNDDIFTPLIFLTYEFNLCLMYHLFDSLSQR